MESHLLLIFVQNAIKFHFYWTWAEDSEGGKEPHHFTDMPSKRAIWICKLLPSLPDGKQHATKNGHAEAPLIKISSQDLLSGLQPLSTKEQAIYCICVSNSTELHSLSGKLEKKKKVRLIVFSCLPVCMFHFKWGELLPVFLSGLAGACHSSNIFLVFSSQSFWSISCLSKVQLCSMSSLL